MKRLIPGVAVLALIIALLPMDALAQLPALEGGSQWLASIFSPTVIRNFAFFALVLASLGLLFGWMGGGVFARIFFAIVIITSAGYIVTQLSTFGGGFGVF